jgi:polysaccharide export outer membrane protein
MTVVNTLRLSSVFPRLGAALALLFLAGCAQLKSVELPRAGPDAKEVASATVGASPVRLVDIDESVSRRLAQISARSQFSSVFDTSPLRGVRSIGAGDFLEVQLWEAPPATLFGGGSSDVRSGPSTARTVVLPEQEVDRDGAITVPFAGKVPVLGKTVADVQAEVVRRLQGKANRPEAVVRLTRRASSYVTVVGDVTASLRMPLTPAGERILDALAAAGGVRQPPNKLMLQLTRGSENHRMPLDQIIRDPRQNVPLIPGDVITAVFQPFSFTALGSTLKNEEVNFEAQGISLAQALARVGGLNDNRSDPKGLFIFRLESRDALGLPEGTQVAATADGLVPVVYRLDLSRPEGFFLMQAFPVRDRDVIYVSNAPAAELQKFLNLVLSIAYPVINTIQMLR